MTTADRPSLPRRLNHALITAAAPLSGGALLALAAAHGVPDIPPGLLLPASLGAWLSGLVLLFRFRQGLAPPVDAQEDARARFYRHVRVAYAGLVGLVLAPIGLVGTWVALMAAMP